MENEKFIEIYMYKEELLCETEESDWMCAPGSEKHVRAKNGLMMTKCTNSECGITKTKFVKNQGN